MTPEEVKEHLKDFKGGPESFHIGDKIDGLEIVDIKNTVNGKPTYASTFVVRDA